MKINRKTPITENLVFILVTIVFIIIFPTLYEQIWRYACYYFSGVVLIIALSYSILYSAQFFSVKVLVFMAIYYVLMIFFTIIHGNFEISYLFNFLFAFPILFVFNYFLYARQKLYKFLRVFVALVFCVAVMSLFFWIFASVLGIMKPTGSVHLEWSGVRVNNYYNLYIEPQRWNFKMMGIQIFRNCSFFCEGPVASFCFSLALLININYAKVAPYLVNTVLIIAVLSTFSTTGFIVLLMVVLQKFIMLNADTILKKIFKFFSVILIVIIVFSLGYTAFSEKMSTISGSIRREDITRNLAAFQKHPIIGNGCGYVGASSNSFAVLLADGGFLLWGLYYFPGIILLLKKIKNGIDWFILIFTGMFLITIVQYRLLTLFIVTMLWCQLLFFNNHMGDVDKWMKNTDN